MELRGLWSAWPWWVWLSGHSCPDVWPASPWGWPRSAARSRSWRPAARSSETPQTRAAESSRCPERQKQHQRVSAGSGGWGWTGHLTEEYLAVRVEGGQRRFQHAAPHLCVSVVQSVRHKEQEEGRHLTLIQELSQFVQCQSNATPAHRKRMTYKPSPRWKLIYDKKCIIMEVLWANVKHCECWKYILKNIISLCMRLTWQLCLCQVFHPFTSCLESKLVLGIHIRVVKWYKGWNQKLIAYLNFIITKNIVKKMLKNKKHPKIKSKTSKKWYTII